jgi:hypothetical protein
MTSYSVSVNLHVGSVNLQMLESLMQNAVMDGPGAGGLDPRDGGVTVALG